MSQQISFQLYKWLVHLRVVPNNQKYKPSGNIQLQSNIHQQLLSGFLIPQILLKLANDMSIDINQPLINSVKKSKSMAARIYNWNILSEGFSKLGVTISKQAQKEVTSGNFNALQRILLDTNKKFNQDKKNQQAKSQFQHANTEIDFKRIESLQSNYEKCENAIQILVLIISNNCKLTPKQSYATLSQNCKYLAHMIVKGIKGSYEQIINLLKNFVSEMPQIMFLVQKDPAKNTSLMLQILKPALISRDADVALEGCKALKALIYESLKYNSKNIVYQILNSQNMGFDFLYMGIKRHPDLVLQINSFLYPLVEHSFQQFFQVQLKKTINNQQQYIKILICLLEGIISNDLSKKKLASSGLLQKWVKNCQDSFNSKKNKEYNNINEQTKIFYLELLCDLWKAYSKELNEEHTQQLMMKGIQQLKKNTRRDIYTVKIPALIRLFDFLDYLATAKNAMASIVYKKIIFLFVENHQENQIRHVILSNFTTIIKKFATIPLQFLLQPLLRQLTSKEGTTYILNMYDFDFMIQVFRHPKMQAAYALNFLQYFSKLYIKNIIYSSLIIRIISLLSSRYCEQQAIMEYITKNVQSNLNLYGMLVMGKRKKVSKDQKIIDNQKKSLIIQLIKLFIKLESMTLNQNFQKSVSKLYVYWKDQKNYTDKGLQYLLTQLGEVDQICLRQRTRKKQKGSIIQQYVQTQSKVHSIPHLRIQSFDSKPKSRLIYDSFDSNQEIYQLKEILSRSKVKAKNRNQQILQRRQFKPDQRNIQDIQKIRQKVRRQSQRKQFQMQKKTKQLSLPRQKINATQLLHRNISLGYAKLPDFNSQNMLFEFESVKIKQLKQSNDFIDIELEEDQDKITVQHILKQYSKYIKAIFTKYAYATTNKQNPMAGDHKLMLTFTQIMRMLKEKNMNTVQKLVINEAISTINRKKKVNRNVLGGLQQEQFSQFLVMFTDLYTKQQRMSQDIPFGCKLQKVIHLLLVNQTIGKQINDKKIQSWSVNFKKANNQQIFPVPEGYKKVKVNQIDLTYAVSQQQSGIDNSFLDCFQVLNEIFMEFLQISIFPPIHNIQESYKIAPIIRLQKNKIPQLLTEKNIKRVFESSEDKVIQTTSEENQIKSNKPLYKSKQLNAMNRSKTKSHKVLKQLNKTQISLQQQKRKIQLQQQYSMKLKAELQQLRAKKQIKQQQEQQKNKQLQQKKRKKQDEHKQYLEKNKEKIKIQKEKQQLQKKDKQINQNQNKQKYRQQIKQKQAELLQKQKNKIKKIQQKVQEKQKQKNKQIQKKKVIQKQAHLKVDILKTQKNQEKQKQKLIIQSLYDNQHYVSKIVKKYDKQITQLFQSYWNWEKKKIQLSGVAHLLKDFHVSPQYVPPKLVSQVYKIASKGFLLDLNSFKQILVKYAYKSQKLSENSQFLSSQVLQKFFSLLKVKEKNYIQIIKLAKLQQL